MSSDENQLVSFRRVVWNVNDYHKILWKSVSSDSFELKISNLPLKWCELLKRCLQK